MWIVISIICTSLAGINLYFAIKGLIYLFKPNQVLTVKLQDLSNSLYPLQRSFNAFKGDVVEEFQSLKDQIVVLKDKVYRIEQNLNKIEEERCLSLPSKLKGKTKPCVKNS